MALISRYPYIIRTNVFITANQKILYNWFKFVYLIQHIALPVVLKKYLIVSVFGWPDPNTGIDQSALG